MSLERIYLIDMAVTKTEYNLILSLLHKKRSYCIAELKQPHKQKVLDNFTTTLDNVNSLLTKLRE
jgi:hypothetical protein